MAEHAEIPIPIPYAFRCSCGALSVGTVDDPALFFDHLHTEQAKAASFRREFLGEWSDPEPNDSTKQEGGTGNADPIV